MGIINHFIEKLVLFLKMLLNLFILRFNSNLIFFYEKNKVKIKELRMMKFISKEINIMVLNKQIN